MNRIYKIALAFVVMLGTVFGQTALTTTTLSAAMTRTQTFAVIASATGTGANANPGAAIGGIGSPATQAGAVIYVDLEAMVIVSISGTTAQVRRGALGTATQPHVSAAAVTVGPLGAFKSLTVPLSGQCQRTLLPYVPVINISNGDTFDCLGVTTAGQWVQTNKPGIPVVGSTVASATTIGPTGTFFVVSGTTAIATITVPAGWKAGMCLAINPSGVFATTTAGNISLITSASVVNRVLTMCWDGSKWNPSYVS